MDDTESPKATAAMNKKSMGETTTQVENVDSIMTAPSRFVVEASEPIKSYPSAASQTKWKRRTLLVALLIVLVFCVISSIMWALFTQKDEYESHETETNIVQADIESDMDDSKAPTSEEKFINETMSLELDDALVQKLYGYFNHSIGVLTGAFYSENGGLSGNVDESLMTSLALEHTVRDKTNLFYTTEQNLGCYKAQPVREKMQEIFGLKVEFFEGMGIPLGEWPLYTYSVNDDAFCLVGGFGNATGVHHNLYKAEKSNYSIILFVVAGIVDTRGAGSTEDFFGTVTPVSSGESNDQYVSYPYHPTGDDNTDIMEYADNLDKFKWTFVWNGENYVFEKLERVQD